MKILFPCHPLEHGSIEPSMEFEYEAAKLAGFEVFLFDHDDFISDGNIHTNLPYRDFETLLYEDIIIRSWMMNEKQYLHFYNSLGDIGYLPINSPRKYIQCHHFPEVYQYISEFTAKTWWSGDWYLREDAYQPENIIWNSVRELLGGDVIIKDYVKSEKGNPDLFILDKELTNAEFGERVRKFIEARGKLFNKGLVFKAVQHLKLYEGQTNEWRLFFLNKNLVTYSLNTEKDIFADAGKPTIQQFNAFIECAKSIPSNFFTMDIAEKEDGSWTILECGDGQVSGLAAHETPIKFYNRLNMILND